MDIIKKYSNNQEKHYLQCVVTNYKSTASKYLANSGALIIYQEPSLNEEHRNYIYLGGEFLASGYGVSTLELSNKLETIAETYNDTIKRLDDADIIEKQEREEEDNKIWEEIENYVQINGGNISKTVITLTNTDGDEVNIPIKNLILHGEEAQYTNLSINNFKITINKKYSGHSPIIIENDVNLKDYDIYLPVGSVIHDICIDVEFDVNDSGGIEKIEALHHNLNPLFESAYREETNNDLDGVIINYDDAVYGYIVDEEHKTAHFSYEKILDEPVYVNKYLEKIISEFYIYVRKTPITSYKVYPGLKDMYNIEIPSTGNAIKENVITLLKNINIKPQYYMFCGYEFTKSSLTSEKYPLNSFINYDITVTTVDIDPSKNFIYISVPSCFAVQKIYVIKNNIEKYNWTGAVDYTNNIELIPYFNTGDIENFAIYYNVYRLYSKNGFIESSNVKLSIQVIYKNAKEPNDADYNDSIDNTKINLRTLNNNEIGEFDSMSYINDEEFNSIYWIKYLDENVSAYNILKQKLDIVNENCAKKS